MEVETSRQSQPAETGSPGYIPHSRIPGPSPSRRLLPDHLEASRTSSTTTSSSSTPVRFSTPTSRIPTPSSSSLRNGVTSSSSTSYNNNNNNNNVTPVRSLTSPTDNNNTTIVSRIPKPAINKPASASRLSTPTPTSLKSPDRFSTPTIRIPESGHGSSNSNSSGSKIPSPTALSWRPSQIPTSPAQPPPQLSVSKIKRSNPKFSNSAIPKFLPHSDSTDNEEESVTSPKKLHQNYDYDSDDLELRNADTADTSEVTDSSCVTDLLATNTSETEDSSLLLSEQASPLSAADDEYEKDASSIARMLMSPRMMISKTQEFATSSLLLKTPAKKKDPFAEDEDYDHVYDDDGYNHQENDDDDDDDDRIETLLSSRPAASILDHSAFQEDEEENEQSPANDDRPEKSLPSRPAALIVDHSAFREYEEEYEENPASDNNQDDDGDDDVLFLTPRTDAAVNVSAFEEDEDYDNYDNDYQLPQTPDNDHSTAESHIFVASSPFDEEEEVATRIPPRQKIDTITEEQEATTQDLMSSFEFLEQRQAELEHTTAWASSSDSVAHNKSNIKPPSPESSDGVHRNDNRDRVIHTGASSSSSLSSPSSSSFGQTTKIPLPSSSARTSPSRSRSRAQPPPIVLRSNVSTIEEGEKEDDESIVTNNSLRKIVLTTDDDSTTANRRLSVQPPIDESDPMVPSPFVNQPASTDPQIPANKKRPTVATTASLVPLPKERKKPTVVSSSELLEKKKQASTIHKLRCSNNKAFPEDNVEITPEEWTKLYSPSAKYINSPSGIPRSPATPTYRSTASAAVRRAPEKPLSESPEEACPSSTTTPSAKYASTPTSIPKPPQSSSSSSSSSSLATPSTRKERTSTPDDPVKQTPRASSQATAAITSAPEAFSPHQPTPKVPPPPTAAPAKQESRGCCVIL